MDSVTIAKVWSLADMEKLLTIIGLAAAALFFGWKLIAGWLIANMDVIIEAERRAKDASIDWLSIKLTLKKGNIDAISLRDVALKIYDPGDRDVFQTWHFEEFNSITISEDRIQWKISNTHSRKYAIATNESFQYGHVVEVRFDRPVIIEAAVFGKRKWWKGGPQWRSSVATLPLAERKFSAAENGKKV